ncbi:hypothetical protein GAO09_21090 [Rhizobiales bacterium RZME27]|jgi:hypothetical protein|uniref:Uncharacterized protein n=1 Tax=Endobacterium cereale TaxID=2663029 RepID=A0A6A8ACR4_9HYPH|nr:hypothetical protein [Endobacterium cereale]MEB2844121.1 hypothetical protein [Endobacterium cereale]MQY48534.1 hypothetical protein [Endobacterium cereale]
MKKVEDLTHSAKTVHDRYAAGRMDREIVRQWAIGLGGYPEPHATAVSDAITWFKPPRDGADPVELKIADLARLQAIYSA